jgi:hypothetical protein
MKAALLFLVILIFTSAQGVSQDRDFGSLKGFSVGMNAAHGTFLARGSSANPEIFVVGRRDENKMKVGHSQVGLNVMYGFRDEMAVYITGSWGFYQESLDSQGASFNRDIGLQYNYFGLHDSGELTYVIPYVRGGFSSMNIRGIYLRNNERNTAFVSPYEGGGLHFAFGADILVHDYITLSADYMIKRMNLKPDREVAQPFPNNP